MGQIAKPVNYGAVADELDNASQCLREQHDLDRAKRLHLLAEQIRRQQRLPPGFREADL